MAIKSPRCAGALRLLSNVVVVAGVVAGPAVEIMAGMEMIVDDRDCGREAGPGDLDALYRPESNRDSCF